MPKRHDNDVTERDIKAELPTVLVNLVNDAIARKWQAVRGGHGNLVLVAPATGRGRRATIELPRNERSLRASVLRSWEQKVRRYGIESADQRRNGLTPDAPPADRKVETVALPPPTKVGEPVTTATLAEKARALIRDQREAAEPKAEPEPKAEAAASEPEVHRGHVCDQCDPPTTWPTASSLNAHKRKHAYEQGRTQPQRNKAALTEIATLALEALGEPLATEADLEQLRQQLTKVTAERDALQTRLDRVTKALS